MNPRRTNVPTIMLRIHPNIHPSHATFQGCRKKEGKGRGRSPPKVCPPYVSANPPQKKSTLPPLSGYRCYM